MAVRYFLLEDLDRVVKVDGALAWVWHDGAWAESAHAWRRVQGIGGDADGREITAPEAERLIAASDRGRRFTWTKEDLASGGVYFHDGEREGNEGPKR
jgi:hypothetical protein